MSIGMAGASTPGDEIVRRITGADSLGHYFDEMFGRPLDLDFWIGTDAANSSGPASPVKTPKIRLFHAAHEHTPYSSRLPQMWT